jgi:hypothetical protein
MLPARIMKAGRRSLEPGNLEDSTRIHLDAPKGCVQTLLAIHTEFIWNADHSVFSKHTN